MNDHGKAERRIFHRIGELRKRYYGAIVGFVSSLTPNFKVMLVRRPIHGIAMNLSNQYDSIYATILGANPVQVGSLRSVGNMIAALMALPAGWLIDTRSLKKVFIAGTIVMSLASLMYFIAPHWVYLYTALILFMVGTRVICTACTVTCANELSNKQRATGRGLCRTTSSAVTLLTPMLAAWIVSVSGGLTREGIRPLYAVQVVIFLLLVILLAIFFKDTSVSQKRAQSGSILGDFGSVLKQGPDVKRMLLLMALMDLPFVMAQPFIPLYAHQIKGADEFMLGGIALAKMVVPLLFSIPLGKIADRYGRKLILFTLAPLVYLSYLCLIWAAGPALLIIFGLLLGFNSIAFSIGSAMAAEVMPKEQMGKWAGIMSLVRGAFSIPAPLVGGFIWDHIGPGYLFIVVIIIDVVFRLPLLMTIKETLHLDKGPGEKSCI